ncbi:unnamed protein product [Amoebophrya sp. A120]|nr:unnamed protein product [Amoebophrya sp. A120]|eukprot:GSA120T00016606001.1
MAETAALSIFQGNNGPKTYDEKVRKMEESFREPQNFKKLTEFLEGKSKRQHLFLYFQKPDMLNEAGEYVDGPGEARVLLSHGETERLKSKACYFLRGAGAVDKPIKVDVSTDGDLLFGEIAAQPLESLHTSLKNIFLPCVKNAEQNKEKVLKQVFGAVDAEHRAEFSSTFTKFTSELTEAIKSLSGGIELKKLDPQYQIDPRVTTYHDIVKEHPDIVTHFEQVLEEWCRQIERYLEETLDSDDPGGSAGGMTLTSGSGDGLGPRSELEYWRYRMQQITSITEHLKSRECKNVFGVLHAVTRMNAESKARQPVFNTLRRWKAIDIQITESYNEAKDNVKYLTTLEKFLEPLYTGTPNNVIDCLPALMNACKMIHTIARYYNTTERMTNLLTKVTNQMILNCKTCILGVDPETGEQNTGPEALWDQDPITLIRNLECCLRMEISYMEEFRRVKDKLATLPKGKQFDFSETLIFGRLQLFCRRVVKLIDMFSTIYQFQSLGAYKFDGMDQLVESFKTILEEFKNKNHNLLDFHNNKFDRDYVEFNVRIADLEAALQQFINHSFESITSITTSLNLLKKFQSILQRETLRADLDSKFTVIFHNYGLELTQVQTTYEDNKGAPPLVRNLPPVAGNITWSRHLLKRIEEPMKKFQTNPSVLAGKDAKKIIRMYNKMAKTLVEFETLWYQAWVHSVEVAKSGLQATLIVRHPDDGKLHVNFDWEILQLIRETKCLDRMGIEIPESAKMVLLQESKFKGYYNELSFILREYRRVVQMVRPIASNLLKPHLDNLEFQLRPGMVTLTWTSMNIESYLANVWRELKKLEQLDNSF